MRKHNQRSSGLPQYQETTKRSKVQPKAPCLAWLCCTVHGIVKSSWFSVMSVPAHSQGPARHVVSRTVQSCWGKSERQEPWLSGPGPMTSPP